MKNKITLLACSLLLTFALTGCAASQTADSSSTAPASSSGASSSGASSSAESSAEETNSSASQGSQSGSSASSQEESYAELSFDEDGNPIIDLDDLSGWEIEESGDDIIIDDETTEEDGQNSEEGNTPSDEILFNYKMIYLSGQNITASVSLPTAYLITSGSELNQFITDNQTLYSLDTEYTDNSYQVKSSFTDSAKDYDEEYFNSNDLAVIVSSYDKSSDCDLGEASAADDTINFEVWTSTPKSDSDIGYVCFLVSLEKGAASGKTLTARINADAFTDEPQ